jgi:magnesium transporter
MSRLFKKRSHKTGLAPGTLIHIGAQQTEPVVINVLDYTAECLGETTVRCVEDCEPFAKEGTVSWLDVSGLHNLPLIKGLGKLFALHPLVLEDILNTEQRPKQEDHADYLFFVIKMLYENKADHTFVVEQVSFILTREVVISFQENPEDIFDPVRQRIRDPRWRIRKLGTDYLVYALIDVIVDNYFHILENIGEAIEQVEVDIRQSPSKKNHDKIHHLVREVIFLRKYIRPVSAVLEGLQESESTLIKPETKVYFNDVHDHVQQAIEMIDSFRDVLENLENLYLSLINYRLNSTMQLLTVITTIFMPLTFIVGVYGMNFENMPELKWHWGYFAVWGIMLVTALMMFVYFKRRKLL